MEPVPDAGLVPGRRMPPATGRGINGSISDHSSSDTIRGRD
jgi:hypothetical protein